MCTARVIGSGLRVTLAGADPLAVAEPLGEPEPLAVAVPLGVADVPPGVADDPPGVAVEVAVPVEPVEVAPPAALVAGAVVAEGPALPAAVVAVVVAVTACEPLPDTQPDSVAAATSRAAGVSTARRDNAEVRRGRGTKLLQQSIGSGRRTGQPR
jgi:hypothetical protein